MPKLTVEGVREHIAADYRGSVLAAIDSLKEAIEALRQDAPDLENVERKIADGAAFSGEARCARNLLHDIDNGEVEP